MSWSKVIGVKGVCAVRDCDELADLIYKDKAYFCEKHWKEKHKEEVKDGTRD